MKKPKEMTDKQISERIPCCLTGDPNNPCDKLLLKMHKSQEEQRMTLRKLTKLLMKGGNENGTRISKMV